MLVIFRVSLLACFSQNELTFTCNFMTTRRGAAHESVLSCGVDFAMATSDRSINPPVPFAAEFWAEFWEEGNEVKNHRSKQWNVGDKLILNPSQITNGSPKFHFAIGRHVNMSHLQFMRISTPEIRHPLYRPRGQRTRRRSFPTTRFIRLEASIPLWWDRHWDNQAEAAPRHLRATDFRFMVSAAVSALVVLVREGFMV